MLLVRHIKYLLTLTSKLEANDTVIALLNQIDKFTKRNSQLAEQLSLVTEQNSLLADQNTQLQKENAALAQRVSKLERSKGLNSGNSSKPPSSDGLKKPPAKANRRTQSRRNTSNRKSGGQPGHKGTTLKQVKKPDKVMNHFPPQCQECEAILSPGDSMKSSNRQVFDLPPPPPLVVTEHRAHTCQCHHCGTQTRAVFPENVTARSSMVMKLQLMPFIFRLITAFRKSDCRRYFWIFMDSRSHRQHWPGRSPKKPGQCFLLLKW